jgi:hypothetical protein
MKRGSRKGRKERKGTKALFNKKRAFFFFADFACFARNFIKISRKGRK